ncbi:pyridoxamine 5'-phosphate oxidase family protein [Halobellus litoreus]|uniref:Pyridoxamine 5'-phosphate oxidase family protein n=1 Tax=Halobellus litoreus TaxID=755310 RepID=A0ABD6DRM8_9EURY|nr:pyridoxamine 5'-phosphate oxidase family protein [Halobellus litoreus]
MASGTYGIEMSDADVAEFLTRQGHGVLSFGGEVPYGLPVSFGYDVLENRCIFQLVFHEGSEKQARLDDSPYVSLVSYEWNGPGDWRSVVITGTLAPIEDTAPAALDASEVFAEYASVAGLSVFDRPSNELNPEWYELTIDELNGRHSPTSDSDPAE